jgi:hypothetical protein
LKKKAHGTNKNIDGFYTKTTQKGGFSKLCVKIKKDVIPTVMKSIKTNPNSAKGPDKGKL